MKDFQTCTLANMFLHSSFVDAMAPFNKRQVGYIKAIANVDSHHSYVDTITGASQTLDLPATAANPPTAPGVQSPLSDPSMRYKFWTLGKTPLTYGTGPIPTADIDLAKEPINVYNVPVYAATADDRAASSDQRISAECYLESVNVKMRLIQNLDSNIDAKSHQEYRMVVFRHKERQSHLKQYAQNFSDPQYDMFVNRSGYKFGPRGYRLDADTQGSLGLQQYSPTTGYSPTFCGQTMLTCPFNKADYVVMKDCRFYLGKEYGGKHIFETKVHFEHQDPIATDSDDISTTDNDKNYVWYIWIGCMTNANNGIHPDFPYTRFDTTTHVTSG